MNTIETHGRIEGGKLTIHNRKRFEQEIAECQNCEVVISVRKWGRRSNQANRYYWGVVLQEIRLRMKELGYNATSEALHEEFKKKFLPYAFHDEEGTILLELPGETKTLNKSDFAEYVDKVRQWASETLSLFIPDPGASNEMMF